MFSTGNCNQGVKFSQKQCLLKVWENILSKITDIKIREKHPLQIRSKHGILKIAFQRIIQSDALPTRLSAIRVNSYTYNISNNT
jgi:hypothetical protein